MYGGRLPGLVTREKCVPGLRSTSQRDLSGDVRISAAAVADEPTRCRQRQPGHHGRSPPAPRPTRVRPAARAGSARAARPSAAGSPRPRPGSTVATAVRAPSANSADVSPITSSPASTAPGSGLAGRQQHQLRRPGQPLQVVRGERAVGHGQRREQRVVAAQHAVRGDVRDVGAVQRRLHAAPRWPPGLPAARRPGRPWPGRRSPPPRPPGRDRRPAPRGDRLPGAAAYRPPAATPTPTVPP